MSSHFALGSRFAASPLLFIFLLLIFAVTPAQAQTSVGFFNHGSDRVLPPSPCPVVNSVFGQPTSDCNYKTQKLAVDAAGNAIALWTESKLTQDGYPPEYIHPVMVSRYSVASNTWTTPQNLQNEQGTVVGIGFDGSGNAIAVWSQAGNFDSDPERPSNTLRFARYITAQGTWTRAATMFQTAGSEWTDLAVSRNGNAFLFGLATNQRALSYLGLYDSATKTWRKLDVRSESTVHHFQPRIASDDAGNAIAVYGDIRYSAANSNYLFSVRYVRYDAVSKTIKQSGVLDSHVRDGNGEVSFSALALTMDPYGKAMALWERTYTAPGTPASAATRSIRSSRYTTASGTWVRKSIPVLSSGKIVGQSELAADHAGNAHAVWVQFIGSYARTVYAKYSATSGSWNTPRVIQSGTYHSRDARVKADRNSNVFATWSQRSDTGTGSSVNAIHRTTAARFDTARGKWGVPRVIQDNARNSYRSELGIDGRGRAVVLWPQDTGRLYPNSTRRIKELRADRLLPE